MDLFEHQWQTYRSVVDHDWMEHRAITEAAGQALRDWMDSHPERHGTARLLDLGCGDLALMGPVFAGLPLGAYDGVDITEQVLPLARAELADTAFTVTFHHADVMQFVEDHRGRFDLVHAALVLHHLTDDDKGLFLSALRRIVPAGGALVWADVFCEPGETRAHYADRYADRIRGGWLGLDRAAREAIVTHMRTFDFPADRAGIIDTARDTGWEWQWRWHGAHRAEAVAVLTAV